jgi:hypothetical protein
MINNQSPIRRGVLRSGTRRGGGRRGGYGAPDGAPIRVPTRPSAAEATVGYATPGRSH